MTLPKHISLEINHNRHVTYYLTVARQFEEWTAIDGWPDCTDEDRAEMLRTGEIWEVTWHPDTPVGSCSVAAATLGRALELANEP